MKKLLLSIISVSNGQALLNQLQEADCGANPIDGDATSAGNIPDWAQFWTPFLPSEVATSDKAPEVLKILYQSETYEATCQGFRDGVRFDVASLASSGDSGRALDPPSWMTIRCAEENENDECVSFTVRYCCDAISTTTTIPITGTTSYDHKKPLYMIKSTMNEVIDSHFAGKWPGWSNRMKAKVADRVNAMDNDFHNKAAKCGLPDSEWDDDSYNMDNPCLAVSQLVQSFVRWSSVYNVNCDDKDNFFHNKIAKQMVAIETMMQNRFSCLDG